VVAGPGRVQASPRVAERDPARGVVQLTVTDVPADIVRLASYTRASVTSARLASMTLFAALYAFYQEHRGASLVVVLVLVTACSTFRPEPPTGLMWAYLGESRTVPSLNLVAYALDRPTCEVSRAKDTKPPANAAWAELKVPGECHQVAVGVGTDYWVFASTFSGSMVALGASGRDWCMKIREGLAQTYPGWLGECRPVAVKPLP